MPKLKPRFNTMASKFGVQIANRFGTFLSDDDGDSEIVGDNWSKPKKTKRKQKSNKSSAACQKLNVVCMDDNNTAILNDVIAEKYHETGDSGSGEAQSDHDINACEPISPVKMFSWYELCEEEEVGTNDAPSTASNDGTSTAGPTDTEAINSDNDKKADSDDEFILVNSKKSNRMGHGKIHNVIECVKSMQLNGTNKSNGMSLIGRPISTTDAPCFQLNTKIKNRVDPSKPKNPSNKPKKHLSNGDATARSIGKRNSTIKSDMDCNWRLRA